MTAPAPATELVPAAPEDAGALCAMAEAIWPEAYGALLAPAQIRYMLDRGYRPGLVREEMESGAAHWYWAAAQGERVGFLSAGPVLPGVKSRLLKCYLLAGARGLGHGGRALASLCSLLVAEGVPEMDLRVNRGNARAIRFYERCGFRTVAEDCLDIGGGFVMDDYIMARRLP